MSDEPAELPGQLDRELRAVASARQRALADHPSAEELVDYTLGAFPADDGERIAEHLALCPDCARLALDLAALADPSSEPSPLAPEVRARAWERFSRRVAAGAVAAPPVTFPARSGSAAGAPRRVGLALAASVLAAVGLAGLGGGFLIGRGTSPEETRRDAPRADVALVDLAPAAEGARRSPEAPERVRVPPGAGRVALLLNLGDLRSFPTYSMEMRAPDGHTIWSTRSALRSEGGSFLVVVPAGRLARPGIYRIEMRGGTALLAEYRFEIVPLR